MRYMLLIHNDPDLHPQPGDPAWDELMAGYNAFAEELSAHGRPWSGDPLAPPATATTVRVRDNQVLTFDGPFAETKEWMSGYFIIEADDLDQALKAAAMVPSAACGSVEVRPIAEM
jgi:hypothetical protein